MYAKANHHAHGVKLAVYLMTAHRGERAELIDLRGFGPGTDMRDGFRSEHIRARDGTHAEKPFFHVYFRSVEGEGKTISTAQWLAIAERCDAALGLSGLARGVSLHINRQTGDRHMHLGYSLVRESTDGRAHVQKLGLYKNKLKELSRAIERDYGLKIIANERSGARGAGRDEDQGRRQFKHLLGP